MSSNYDVIVVGAGISGLTAAALLAHSGRRVLLLEGHIEPGGCASTYERRRPNGDTYLFDVGATLFAGFQPGGAHHWVGQRLGITWPVRPLEPAMDVLLPDALVRRFGDQRWPAERHAAFGAGAERFWHLQEQTAAIAWRFAARFPPLPLETPADLLGLAAAFRPELALLAPGLVTTVGQALQLSGAHGQRLRTFIDAQLLISAQTTSPECAWLFGAAALDFARIGAHYVAGGAWGLARTLEAALLRDGGELRYRSWVTRIVAEGGAVRGVELANGERLSAPQVITSTTVWDTARLLGEAAPARLTRRLRHVPPGWGACTLYLGLDACAIPPGSAEHIQVVRRYDAALGEANSVFISVHPADDLSRAPTGQRAVTVSTHTDPARWLRWRAQGQRLYREQKALMAERMLDTVALALPKVREHIRYQQIGTPVSFQRYTQRQGGMVGGLPQRRSSSGLLSLGPRAAGVAGLWLVGDSTFPGQSTAAVTQGAIRVVRAIEGSHP